MFPLAPHPNDTLRRPRTAQLEDRSAPHPPEAPRHPSPWAELASLWLLSLLVLALPVAAQEAPDAATPEAQVSRDQVAMDPVGLPQESIRTERFYLSGTGRTDTRPWRFALGEAPGTSGATTRLPVPSHWEMHGHGVQNYGHDDDKAPDQGHYATDFRVPEDWRGRRIDLVFEGVMTDTTARLNGESVGPTHRGSFYRFRYPVDGLLRLDGLNTLEVTVDEQSADASVNRAERDADYWVFGGIFRPVYLESRPAESIRRLALDARHDGALALYVELEGLEAPATLQAQVEDGQGRRIGAPHTVEVSPGAGPVEMLTRIPGVEPWSAEIPKLYHLRLDLIRDGQRLHREEERFGFRTIELRPEEGLFVNGHRVRLRGVNRHAFWPTSGRTLDADLDRRDVELMKQLNLNAVRSSHYPPDPSFLEACDEFGLYVINELAGWHDAYGTEVGTRLVREMVERDVNHPSVILWANGNEGGWNRKLDDLFALHDPSQRQVFHPHENFRGVDAFHYPTWEELEERLDDDSWLSRWRGLWGPLPLVLPTEILHGLYDGGSGAGLARYWDRIRDSPRGVGLFLWSFTDESLARVDRDGTPDRRRLDSDGNHAPDGILGPFRETTGSFYAVREVFAPLRIEASPEDLRRGTVRLENRHDHLDLDRLQLHWAWLDLPAVVDPGSATGSAEVLDRGVLRAPSLAPGGKLEHSLGIPAPSTRADALRLIAVDPRGRPATEILTRVLPLRDLRSDHALLETLEPRGSAVTAQEIEGHLTLVAGDTVVEIDQATGWLAGLRRGHRSLSLAQGPRPSRGPAPRVVERRVSGDGDGRSFEALLEGDLGQIRWTLFPSGWLRLELAYEATADAPYHGVRFDYPRPLVSRFEWLGEGPTRQWGNRRQGGVLGTWDLDAQRTTPPHRADGPKLAGYYGEVVWARLETLEGTLELAFESPELDLGLFTPRFPADAKEARAEVPDGGLHLLGKMPEIGTKFHPPEDLAPAPESEAPVRVEGIVWLRIAD